MKMVVFPLKTESFEKTSKSNLFEKKKQLLKKTFITFFLKIFEKHSIQTLRHNLSITI